MKKVIRKNNVWIVIPAFNEEKTLGFLLEKIKKTKLKIIVVNDGSSDFTRAIAEKCPVYLINHKTNLGKGASMKTGAEFAFSHGAEAIVFMDADGQHDPKNIPDYIQKLQEGNDIVFGKRNLSKRTPRVRLWGNKTASFLIAVFFGLYREDLLCGFIAMTRKAYEIIQWASSGYGVETEIVAMVGKNKLKYSEVPIETIYRDKYKGVTIFDAFKILFNIPSFIIKRK